MTTNRTDWTIIEFRNGFFIATHRKTGKELTARGKTAIMKEINNFEKSLTS